MPGRPLCQKLFFDRDGDTCSCCAAAMSVPPPRYKRPPIIERVVSLRAEMDQNVYDRGFDEWQEWVQKEFPVSEPVKNWHVNIQRKNGIPSDFSSELQITPRFSEKSAAQGFDWSVRCPIGQLTMNMHSGPKNNRNYLDLRERFPSWLEKWISHFKVEKFTDLVVHYVNRLDSTTLPSFVKNGQLEIDKVLRIFFNISTKNEDFTSPIDLQLTLILKGEPEGRLFIHLEDASHDSNPALTLNLVVSTSLRKGQSTSEILSLVDWCHTRLVERFELIFTDEAKLTFDPL